MNNIDSSVKQSLKDLNLENFDLLLLPVQGMDKSALTVSQPAVQLHSAASKPEVAAHSLHICSCQLALHSQSSQSGRLPLDLLGQQLVSVL